MTPFTVRSDPINDLYWGRSPAIFLSCEWLPEEWHRGWILSWWSLLHTVLYAQIETNYYSNILSRRTNMVEWMSKSMMTSRRYHHGKATDTFQWNERPASEEISGWSALHSVGRDKWRAWTGRSISNIFIQQGQHSDRTRWLLEAVLKYRHELLGMYKNNANLMIFNWLLSQIPACKMKRPELMLLAYFAATTVAYDYVVVGGGTAYDNI